MGHSPGRDKEPETEREPDQGKDVGEQAGSENRTSREGQKQRGNASQRQRRKRERQQQRERGRRRKTNDGGEMNCRGWKPRGPGGGVATRPGRGIHPPRSAPQSAVHTAPPSPQLPRLPRPACVDDPSLPQGGLAGPRPPGVPLGHAAPMSELLGPHLLWLPLSHKGQSKGRLQPLLSPNPLGWERQSHSSCGTSRGLRPGVRRARTATEAESRPPPLSGLIPPPPPSRGRRCKTKRVPLSRLHNSASQRRPIFKSQLTLLCVREFISLPHKCFIH